MAESDIFGEIRYLSGKSIGRTIGIYSGRWGTQSVPDGRYQRPNFLSTNISTSAGNDSALLFFWSGRMPSHQVVLGQPDSFFVIGALGILYTILVW